MEAEKEALRSELALLRQQQRVSESRGRASGPTEGILTPERQPQQKQSAGHAATPGSGRQVTALADPSLSLDSNAALRDRLERAEARAEAAEYKLQSRQAQAGANRNDDYGYDPIPPPAGANIDRDARAAAGRRLSASYAPLSMPEPTVDHSSVQLTRTAKTFAPKLELVDSRPPTLEQVTRMKAAMATFFAKERGADMPHLAAVMDDPLRDLVVSNNLDLMDANTVYSTSNEVLFRCLMRLSAPKSEKQSYDLLRETQKRFGLPEGTKISIHNFSVLLPHLLNYLKHFKETYESIVTYADPAYHPGMKSFATNQEDKRRNSLLPVLLEPIARVCSGLAEEVEQDINKVQPKVTGAIQAIAMVEKSIKDDTALLDRPEVQRLLRILKQESASAKPPSARQPEVQPQRHPHHQADSRTPYRSEQRPFRMHAIQHQDPADAPHGEHADQAQRAHTHAALEEEHLDPEQEQADLLGEEHDEQDASPAEDDEWHRCESYSEGFSDEARTPALKAHALSHNAISAAQAKETKDMPCFAMYRAGVCSNRDCKYGHTKELMRARWQQDMDALKRNPFSDSPVPGGRQVGVGGGQFGRNIITSPYPTARNARTPDGPRHKSN